MKHTTRTAAGGLKGVWRDFHARTVLTFLTAASVIWLVAAVAIVPAEAGYPKATILDFEDALYWAVTTLTTTGYGDLHPVSPLGRVLSGTLMIVGVMVSAAVTGTIVAGFMSRGEEE